ncbi:MAG: threonylcarbamoyl-AMP synthase [Bacteroidetes bacterium]|nr:threonylcarbamoyl-AMP synthase [Bacteroidota bacterium]
MIWLPTAQKLNEAADILKRGGIGAIPTETVYGLAADALNPIAVARIFEAKNRPVFNPLIVHMPDAGLLPLISTIDLSRIDSLIHRFWPGPLTLVVPKRSVVPGITTGDRESVAVRVPAHPIARHLIAAAGGFLAAPSANPSNYLSPTRADHVEHQLSDRIDFILDGGPCRVGVESTIVSLLGPVPVLLRHGGLSTDALRQFLPDLEERHAPSAHHQPLAPGQLAVHYSPSTPLAFWEGQPVTGSETGFISWSHLPEDPAVRVFRLSEHQDLTEAAARLFSILHDLDRAGLKRIVVERVPETGLGRAIMDRLKRAVAGHVHV